MPHDVFVSHSHQDRAAAAAVVGALEESGIRCWVAPRDIAVGAEWGAAIVEAIGESRLLVLLLSAPANASPQVLREVERAVNKRVAIVPVRVEPVEPSGAMEYYLSTAHWLDAFSPSLEAHLDALRASVRAKLGLPVWVPAVPDVRETVTGDARPRRPCPDCAELVLVDAKRCRYCGVELSANPGSPGEVDSSLRMLSTVPAVDSSADISTTAVDILAREPPAVPIPVPAMTPIVSDDVGLSPNAPAPAPSPRLLRSQAQQSWRRLTIPKWVWWSGGLGILLAVALIVAWPRLQDALTGDAITDGTPAADSMFHLVSVASPAPLRGSVMGVTFTSNGQRAFIASYDDTAHVWDTRTWQPVGRPIVDSGLIRHSAFDAIGRFVAVARFDSTMVVWDANNGIRLAQVKLGAGVGALAISGDGQRVALALEDSTVGVWDATGAPLGEARRIDDSCIACKLAFNPDGRRLATPSDSGAQFRDERGQPVDMLKVPPRFGLSRFSRFSFSPDGSKIALFGDNVWSCSASSDVPACVELRHKSEVTALAFSPDGKYLATASANTIQVWDARTGALAATSMRHRLTYAPTLSFDGGGRTLYLIGIATGAEDNGVRVWTLRPRD